MPRKCAVCGKLETDLCSACKRELGIASQICPMCEEESVMGWTHAPCKTKMGMDGLITLFEYGDMGVRKVIDGIKYEFNKSLVSRVFEKIKIETGVVFDYIVPVPLYFYRQNWRGFNQAEMIAEELQKQVGGEVACLLKRNKNTKQQALMASRKERQKNVEDAFCLNTEKLQKSKTQNIDDFELKDKKVLLVDDVFTTGSNMKECCKELKKAGAVVVWGFVLGH